MLNGKTKSGFEFGISKDTLDDYELLEMLTQADEGAVWLIPKLAKKILGADQEEKLKNHVRDENGKVSMKKMAEELTDIFAATGELKNS